MSAEKKRTRQPNGASTVYLGNDDRWHGRVTVGVRDDGTPDRRHVSRKSRGEAIKAVRALEKARDAGAVKRPGKAWTVERWLLHWLEHIARPSLRQSSYDAYRVAVEKHLVPGVGAHRLDKLEPEHLERLYAKMIGRGSSPGTAHQAHRTIRTALGEAARRSHVVRNVAALAKAPRLTDEEIEPYSVDEVKRILSEGAKERNGTRWAIALALGLRQGEALGLKWSDVDLANGTIYVRRGRVRPKYEHGCGGKCTRKLAGYCPRRVLIRPEAADTKSRAGKRKIGLPAELVTLLERHREEQDREHQAARQLWSEGDWVFASPTGQPVNPNTDYHAWKRLLSAVGVRDGRLHDARHTAATVLLLLGVPERAVMGVMGWATTSMAARYQHVTDQIRQDIASRVDGLIWEPQATPPKPAEQEEHQSDDGLKSVA